MGVGVRVLFLIILSYIGPALAKRKPAPVAIKKSSSIENDVSNESMDVSFDVDDVSNFKPAAIKEKDNPNDDEAQGKAMGSITWTDEKGKTHHWAGELPQGFMPQISPFQQMPQFSQMFQFPQMPQYPQNMFYPSGLNPYSPMTNAYSPAINPYFPGMNTYDHGMAGMNPYSPGITQNLYDPYATGYHQNSIVNPPWQQQHTFPGNVMYNQPLISPWQPQVMMPPNNNMFQRPPFFPNGIPANNMAQPSQIAPNKNVVNNKKNKNNSIVPPNNVKQLIPNNQKIQQQYPVMLSPTQVQVQAVSQGPTQVQNQFQFQSQTGGQTQVQAQQGNGLGQVQGRIQYRNRFNLRDGKRNYSNIPLQIQVEN